MLDAACWGAVMGGATYSASTLISGNPWTWSGLGNAMGHGAIQGQFPKFNFGSGLFPSMAAGALNGAYTSALDRCITNLFQNKYLFGGAFDFNTWGANAITSGILGGLNGLLNAERQGENVWWGGKVAKNRTQWSFNNSDLYDSEVGKYTRISKALGGDVSITKNWTWSDGKGMCTYSTLNDIYRKFNGSDLDLARFTAMPEFRASFDDGLLGYMKSGKICGLELNMLDNFGSVCEQQNKFINPNEIADWLDQGNQVGLVYSWESLKIPQFTYERVSHFVGIEQINIGYDGSFNMLVRDSNYEVFRQIGSEQFMNSFITKTIYYLGK